MARCSTSGRHIAALQASIKLLHLLKQFTRLIHTFEFTILPTFFITDLSESKHVKKYHYFLIILTGFIVLGCSPDNSAKTKLFEQERAALEKAKAVESTVLQQSQQLQQNAEKQTQ